MYAQHELRFQQTCREQNLQALEESGRCVTGCAAYQNLSPQLGTQLVSDPHLAPRHPSNYKRHNTLALQNTAPAFSGCCDTLVVACYDALTQQHFHFNSHNLPALQHTVLAAQAVGYF